MDNAARARAIAEMAVAAIETAREVGQEERARLGRELTEAEVMGVADLVERQLHTALAIMRIGG